MKLVMIYNVGDNCTWSSRITKPIEYESVEKAEYDFLNLCEKAFAAYQGKEFATWTCNGYFYFCGEKYNSFDFYISEVGLGVKRD